MSNRKQVVKIGGILSSEKIVNIGVPQGTILGPLLFLLYINDLPKLINFCNVILYADDTTLVFRNSDSKSLQNECNLGLKVFYEWSLANRMSVNFDKTSCLLVTNRPIFEHEFNINCCDIFLEFKPFINFLGVIVDKNLKFNYHTEMIGRKISKSIGIMYNSRNLIPNVCMRSLYFSFVNSYLQYCVVVWGGTYQRYLQPLMVLQKRAIRLVYNAPFLESTNNLFYQCRSLKIIDLYSYNLGMMIFRGKLENLPIHSHEYLTRNRVNFATSFHRLTLTQHSVTFCAVKFWNSLPSHLKLIREIHAFKLALKNYILCKYSQ